MKYDAETAKNYMSAPVQLYKFQSFAHHRRHLSWAPKGCHYKVVG